MRLAVRRPSPATIIATLALLVALSGSAAAATGMIGSRQVIDGSLTGRDVRPGSIQRSDLAPGARAGIDVTREGHQFGYEAEVRCAAGETAIGGGGSANLMDVNEPMMENGTAVGWHVSGHPDPAGAGSAAGDGPSAHGDAMAQVYAICEHH